MHPAAPISVRLLASSLLLVASACGDDADPSTDDGASSPSDTSAGDPSTSAGESGSGELGPTARVRVVNLVQGVELTAWGADTDFNPVMITEGLAYASASDYFDAPLNAFTMHPEVVLVPTGEVVENVATWQVDNSMGPDRAFVSFTELDGADQQATIIVTLDDSSGNLQYEQLDESELMLGDASMANLHISWDLFDLEGGVVAAFSVVGDPCLFSGSTGVPQAWPVAPGSFEVGIYDQQIVSDCTMQLASIPITAAAGDQVLVAAYHEGADVKLLSAAIPQ
jgi:hypothetical protein